MIFVPYQPKIKITRFPWVTLFVTVLCLIIYWGQSRNVATIESYAESYCTPDIAEEIEYAQQKYIQSRWKCPKVLSHIYMWQHAFPHLEQHIQWIMKHNDVEAAETLKTHYKQFSAAAPRYKEAGYWHWQGQWNPLRFISSTFAHASWDHVIGNLFFFVAFSIVVETILGPILFLATFFAMVFAIGTVVNLENIGSPSNPSLGLSGVVMGMMVLAAYFAPRVKIKVFYFFFLYIGVLYIPLWFIATWFVAWDAIDNLTQSGEGGIAYSAHLAGALIALLLGVTLYRNKRHWVQTNLVPDELALTENETGLERFRALSAAPVAIMLVFFSVIAVLYLFSKLLVAFWVQLLLLSPIIYLLAQIQKINKQTTPDWDRYQKAMQALKQHDYTNVARQFEELARHGYSRAQLELSGLYAAGKGVVKDMDEAVRWLQDAADRGYAPAQYRLGAYYLDGHGVARDPGQTIKWYDLAARGGLPEAAMGLGYVYEYHPDKQARDPSKAIEAYAHAAKLFISGKDIEGAKSAVDCIRSIDSGSQHIETIEQLIPAMDEA